jgi:hypothetical protein
MFPRAAADALAISLSGSLEKRAAFSRNRENVKAKKAAEHTAQKEAMRTGRLKQLVTRVEDFEGGALSDEVKARLLDEEGFFGLSSDYGTINRELYRYHATDDETRAFVHSVVIRWAESECVRRGSPPTYHTAIKASGFDEFKPPMVRLPAAFPWMPKSIYDKPLAADAVDRRRAYSSEFRMEASMLLRVAFCKRWPNDVTERILFWLSPSFSMSHMAWRERTAPSTLSDANSKLKIGNSEITVFSACAATDMGYPGMLDKLPEDGAFCWVLTHIS